MKTGDSIKILLSCGIVEEGIIEILNYVDDFDNESYIVLSHLSNPSKKLNIKKKFIAAYQIEESINIEAERKVLIVDDLSLNEPIVNHKLRIKKLAELRIMHSKTQRKAFKKIIENQNIDEKTYNVNYNTPNFNKK
jgi:hypothetical protein